MLTLPFIFFDVSSVVVVVILGDEDIVLLQESGKVLADQSSHIQERHHHNCHADKTKGCLEHIQRSGRMKTKSSFTHELSDSADIRRNKGEICRLKHYPRVVCCIYKHLQAQNFACCNISLYFYWKSSKLKHNIAACIIL